MFRRQATPYGTPRIPKIRDWLSPLAVGALLLSFAGVDLYRGHFSYRRIIFSAADHPILYWAYLLFFGALGVFMFRVAFSQFKKWRRETRTRRS